jgi:hypothetical protein
MGLLPIKPAEVLFSYTGPDIPARRNRIRAFLEHVKGEREQWCYWTPGPGDIEPYCLWRLAEARKAGYLIFPEGESDCWTLWFHLFPALGRGRQSLLSAQR